MNRFILSGFSDEMYEDFAEQLAGHASLGIDNIELRFINGKNVSTLTNEEIADTAHLLSSNGIKVTAIGSPLGKIKLDDDFDEHIEKARRVFHIANVMGAKFIRVFSFYPREGADGFPGEDAAEVKEKLRRLVALGREWGVTLCLENEKNVYGEGPDRARELLDTFCGELKCVFDMGNFVLDGYDPVAAYEKLSPYVAYFHIKDATREGEIVPNGEGDASIAEILAAHHSRTEGKIIVSLEPHLVEFKGLAALTDATLKQDTSVGDGATAYTYAANKFKEIIAAI